MEVFTRESTYRERDKKPIFSTWREQKMDVFILGNLPEETELETKMQYSLPGGDKDGGIYTREST